jgi:predicted RNA-binding protein with PIN domain
MQAESVLLEPYYAFRLEVPAAQIGRAITDIRAMGGEHGQPEAVGENMVLTGQAPVAGMADYMTEVIAYTRGKGRLSCHMAGYQPCHNAAAVIEAMDYDPEADVDNTPSSVFCAHGAGFNVPWDQVADYMHLDSGLKKDAPVADLQPRVYQRNLDIDEKELEAIMEREFGSIRRKQYTAPVVNSAVAVTVENRKKERLLVDGYNVIHAWDELKALAEVSLDLARVRLTDMLASYQGYTKSEVVLVFDAYGVAGGQGSKTTQDGFHVAFTPEGETADMYIERLANEIGKNESVRVVTSDSLVGLTALRSGVLRTSSRAFQDEVYWVLEQIQDIVKRSQE